MSNKQLYVDELVIYKNFRGKGHGKRLAKMLPVGTKLLASPIPDDDGSIEPVDLVKFYSECGFELEKDKYGNPYMVKKC